MNDQFRQKRSPKPASAPGAQRHQRPPRRGHHCARAVPCHRHPQFLRQRRWPSCDDATGRWHGVAQFLHPPPAGDIPDREANDKFGHKLDFLGELTGWWQGRKAEPGLKAIKVGDLNIAPLETDVWSHKQLLKVVSHTPIEVDALNGSQSALDWYDAVRHFIPPEEKLYTWWSYRAKDWSAADKGRRLDHIWVTPPLKDSLVAAGVHRAARGWEKPSDHAPVLDRPAPRVRN